MYCTKCGSEIKEGSKFCINCGNEISTDKKENVSIMKIVIAIVLFIAIVSILVINMMFSAKKNTQDLNEDDINSSKSAIELVSDATISSSGAYFYISENEISKSIDRCNKKYDYKYEYNKQDDTYATISYKNGKNDITLVYMSINNFGAVGLMEIFLSDKKSKECLEAICPEIFPTNISNEIIKCVDELGEYEYRFSEDKYYLSGQNMLIVIPATEDYKKEFLEWVEDESTQEIINPNNRVLKENPVKASR